MTEGSKVSEHRKKQNREAQRTYRKSLLKRIEELENRQNAAIPQSCEPQQDAESQRASLSPQSHGDIPMPSASTTMTGPRPLAGVLQDPDSFEGGSSHFANYDNVLGNDYLQVLRRGDTIYFDGKPGTPASVDLLSGLLPLDKDALPHAQHQGTHGDIFARQAPGATALHSAIISGNETVVKLLLDRRADVDALTQGSKNALHLAVESGQAMIVRMVLEAGTNISCMDDSGYTPLHKAAMGGMEDIVRLLLDYGADVNLPAFQHSSAGSSTSGKSVFSVQDLQKGSLAASVGPSCDIGM